MQFLAIEEKALRHSKRADQELPKGKGYVNDGTPVRSDLKLEAFVVL